MKPPEGPEDAREKARRQVAELWARKTFRQLESGMYEVDWEELEHPIVNDGYSNKDYGMDRIPEEMRETWDGSQGTRMQRFGSRILSWLVKKLW